MRKDLDTPLLSFYSRLTALAKLNLLFLLCALPLVTAGASAAALMGALDAWRRQEHWTAGAFFRAFGRSLRRGAVLWVGMPVLGALRRTICCWREWSSPANRRRWGPSSLPFSPWC